MRKAIHEIGIIPLKSNNIFLELFYFLLKHWEFNQFIKFFQHMALQEL